MNAAVFGWLEPKKNVFRAILETAREYVGKKNNS